VGVPTESRNQALPGAAQLQMRLGGGFEAALHDAAGQGEQLRLEPARVRGGVGGHLRLLGPLQEAVDDLDPLGAGAQPGKRVDQPLG
jgi:hypothetical protein